MDVPLTFLSQSNFCVVKPKIDKKKTFQSLLAYCIEFTKKHVKWWRLSDNGAYAISDGTNIFAILCINHQLKCLQYPKNLFRIDFTRFFYCFHAIFHIRLFQRIFSI